MALGLLILKDGEGMNYTDPRCRDWFEAAQANDLMFWLYYFGTNSAPGDVQAHECMSDVRNLLGTDADLGQHVIFYANTSTLHGIHDPGVVGDSDVWAAQYGGTWPTLGSQWKKGAVLWQFMGAGSTDPNEFPSDQQTYPRSFRGIGNVDRSAFQGSLDNLKARYGTGVHVCLDFESNPGNGGTMTFPNAQKFVQEYLNAAP